MDPSFISGRRTIKAEKVSLLRNGRNYRSDTHIYNAWKSQPYREPTSSFTCKTNILYSGHIVLGCKQAYQYILLPTTRFRAWYQNVVMRYTVYRWFFDTTLFINAIIIRHCCIHTEVADTISCFRITMPTLLPWIMCQFDSRSDTMHRGLA